MSNENEIREQLIAGGVTAEQLDAYRAAVLTGHVKVEVDPTLHDREPGTDTETRVWALLDTLLRLLQEGAVLQAWADIRDQIEEAGGTFGTDEELRAMLAENGKTMRDVAPFFPGLAEIVSGVFLRLGHVAFHDIADGFGFQIDHED